MRSLYTLIYFISLILRTPLGLLQIGRQGERRDSLGQRLGRFKAKTKQALTNRNKLWIHASSQPAIDLLTNIITELEPRAPFLKIVVSTRTNAGMDRLRRTLPSHIERFFLPFDLPRPALRTLNVIHPEVILMLEPELPPNLMRRCKQRRVPVVLANGAPDFKRRRHRWLWPLYRPLYADVHLAVARNDAESAQLRRLGCRKDSVETVGDWPIAPVKLRERRPLDVADLLRRVGAPDQALIILGDHLHAGEEECLAKAYLKLKPAFPKLFLIITPDLYQRGKEVGRALKSIGLNYAYRTAVTAVMKSEPGSKDCLIVNTRGESPQFCEQANVIVLGKTLIAQGGENPTEAAALGKPIVLGPHTQDHAEMTAELLEAGGAIQLQTTTELPQALESLLRDDKSRKLMGEAAKNASMSHRGTVERLVDTLLKLIDERERGE
jgi:3-deoxy-D-manno-octulosonic-acid transferase